MRLSNKIPCTPDGSDSSKDDQLLLSHNFLLIWTIFACGLWLVACGLCMGLQDI
jgi:hypothetical protein